MKPALYVYGIVEASSLEAAPKAGGVNPARRPTLFETGELTAVVSEVDVSEFEGEALERNASQPDWLEAKVRGHESVLDEIVTATTVVPMRFGSIFSDPDGLRVMLAEHEAALKRSLERVRDRSEWGVKVHCDQRALSQQLAGSINDEPSSGRDYLTRKRAELQAQTEAAQAAASVASEVHQALSAVADEAATMSSRSAAPSIVVLNGAYLVQDADRESFMRRVEELQEAHAAAYIFEVTGPWPPYNFVSADVSGPHS